ncbi:hypothetical protein LX15_004804 [Streptoalloteichus tenebrarius]|uniref:Tail terminator n=1 Tax=Streptoalloteichus tenebrarius (strain ATCC 17920 / DSM 40477 / JCM 4838 / CBS 697.72 / NBRC 16177 / NCIMB 11028 / NRRL B-12390 / A12253. 1 / ISP 5477) TaxID=1933 RepID=A0ABT1I001_STRSD|nr:minor capsid protein [Streptoalloteichus tenebrarius]MCP2261084.1 hypothetical protein [Streptoalloteichus tenebrarius]BFF03121.1 hypothetical protein GCM10020241_47960 [Streptoalloteichus tenebrarius]
MTLLEQLAHLLHDLGLGVYRADGRPGGDVFLAVLPQAPDSAVAVARYGGGEADSLLGWDEPRIQVRVRGPARDARVAEARAQAVYDALHGLGPRALVGGTWLQLVVGVTSGPAYIGRDQAGRHEYTVNLRLEIRNRSVNRR